MSAKNRGTETAQNEFYETPEWPIHLILDELKDNGTTIDTPTTLKEFDDWWWLDAGAGNGAIIKACKSWFELNKRKQPKWTAVEIDPKHRAALESLVEVPTTVCGAGSGGICLINDFAHGPLLERNHKVALFNPPFSEAQAFAQAALTRANTVIMLQRLSWLEPRVTEDFIPRNEWLASNMPDVYIIRRPAFMPGSGRTDAAAYAFFVWYRGYGRVMGRIKILPLPQHDKDKISRRRNKKARKNLKIVGGKKKSKKNGSKK